MKPDPEILDALQAVTTELLAVFELGLSDGTDAITEKGSRALHRGQAILVKYGRNVLIDTRNG